MVLLKKHPISVKNSPVKLLVAGKARFETEKKRKKKEKIGITCVRPE